MFYLRSNELVEIMRKVNEKTVLTKLISITGSRKIGKTAFAKQFIHLMSGAYITVTKSSTKTQLDDIVTYLNSFSTLEGIVPEFNNWSELLIFFFELGKERQTNIIIDEFHNLVKIEPDILDVIKNLHELHKHTCEVNILFVSHDYDFLDKLFKSPESPLFQLQYHSLNLSPFLFHEIFSIYKYHRSKLSTEEIIRIYTVFGGFPKYVHLFDMEDLYDSTLEEVLERLVFRHYAPLGYELKDLILNNFSRDSETYIKILTAIGGGRSTLSQISAEVGIPVTTISKYIYELERKRGIVKKKQPLNLKSKTNSKLGRYFLSNYFENFWFKFVQPNLVLYELEYYVELFAEILPFLREYTDSRKLIIIREFIKLVPFYSYFSEKYPGHEFSIGSLWDRTEEIEIVAVDETRKKVIYGFVFISTPCSYEMINIAAKRVKYFKNTFKNYKKETIVFYCGGITKDASDLAGLLEITVLDCNHFIDQLANNKMILEKVLEIPEFFDIEAGNLF